MKRDLTGNFPGLPAVFPDTMAPVVHTAPDGERELSMGRWGFPPPPNLGKMPVTNVRNLKSPYWRGWLKAEWRCLVPATSFCEWTDSRPKVTHWFAIKGKGRVTAFETGPKAVTLDFNPGDIGYIKRNNGHYVKNVGDTDMQYLEVFRSSYYADVSLSDWLTHSPPEMVAQTLNIDEATIAKFPNDRPLVMPK